MLVSTIGYEGLNVDAFLTLLDRYGVETVVDIRELPLSRKPGFSKKALAAALSDRGYRYVHMVDLGCPKPVRHRYRTDGNWVRYTEGFLKYLRTQGTALAELADLIRTSHCVLLCYEADFNLCHRSMVANAVSERVGARIQHIRPSDVTATDTAGRRLAFA